MAHRHTTEMPPSAQGLVYHSLVFEILSRYHRCYLCTTITESTNSPLLLPAALFSLSATLAIALDTLLPSSYALQNPLWFRAFAILASLFSILAFVFSAVLWYDTRVKFEQSGIDAKYGYVGAAAMRGGRLLIACRPALWILLGGTIAAALSLCVGGPRFTGVSRALPD